MLLNVSPIYLYEKGKEPSPVSKLHRPYFIAFVRRDKDIEKERASLIEKWKRAEPDSPLSMISEMGKVESYKSFANLDKKLKVFKVYTQRSGQVPQLSDYLFQTGFSTAEHDIPYWQRAGIDLAVFNDLWIFDTRGKKEELTCLTYDIETFQYEEGKANLPIDILGYSDFSFAIRSKKDLGEEDFSFELLDFPANLEKQEPLQLVARNEDEEIDNLVKFCELVKQSDIIAGHNSLSFDNLQIWERIKWLVRERGESLSELQRKAFKEFLDKYSYPNRSFYFGKQERTVIIYPTSFDTYHAARKFYKFLNDYSLKSIAPFLGIKIKNRIYLQPSQLRLDERTLKYNKQDVQEELGVAGALLQQALPLAFTTSMPFEDLLPTGAVHLWDHMALVRGAYHRKLMPALCRAYEVSKEISKKGLGGLGRRELAQKAGAEEIDTEASKDFQRVVKYGEEMPEWVEYPEVIYGKASSKEGEMLGYHIPGGMTLKPDTDLASHFVPWYKVIVADVGAMYPTILKAVNAGADSTGLAKPGEPPQDWIWLRRLTSDFLERRHCQWRTIDKRDEFADKGVMVGVKKSSEPGLVNLAMGAIMKLIARVKAQLKEVEKKGEKQEYVRLKQMYQSLKGARNAGSVDGSRRIIIQDPKGNLTNIPIGEFVDQAITRYGTRKEIINGVEFELVDLPENWKAISINPDGKVELKRIKQGVRHGWNGKMVRITTKSGSTLVTPNHSIFTIKKGKIKPIQTREIDGSTLIVHAGKIPSIEKELQLSLIEAINDPGFYAFVEKEDLDYFDGFKEKLISLDCKSNSPYLKIPLDKLKRVDLPVRLLRHVSIGSNGKKASRIPCLIPLNEGFAELIGYYISEGHITMKLVRENPQYYICFSSASEEMHQRIREIVKDIFSIPVYTLDRRKDNGSIVSTIHAKIVYYLLEELLNCGTRSRNKSIPRQILSAPTEVKKSFLGAYMEGDGNYKLEMPSTTPHGRYTTNSKSLNEDLIILQRQVGRLTNTYYRPNDKTYNTRMIGYFKGKKKVLNDSFAIPPKKVELVDPTSEWVYDLSVEDNENFLDSEGCILLHNTHGILCAPTVASRQFNLWGAAYITTQGQKILGDTLKTLSANKIRVVYGDTDGIYVACSRSAHNLPSLAKTLGIEATPLDKYWLTHPADALKIINECNEKWRERLNYPGFELESEAHDVMIFVKHKNYLIFDESNGQFSMATKGNNFKGSDKPNIARIALERIMKEVLKENLGWEDEAKAREAVRQSIKRITKGLISKLDLSALNLDDLTLVQSVQPSRRYKPNPNGSISVFGARAKALEQLIGVPIRIATKFKFVVTKKPLPGILHPTKSGVKPIDYMYPIELLKDRSEIDLRWYRELIENFIKGAFGLEGMERGVQRGLADWM